MKTQPDLILIANAAHARLFKQARGEPLELLERQVQQGRFGALALFASSPFLGGLKAELADAVQRVLHSTHDLDLTSVGMAELGPRLKQELAPR